MSLTTVAIDPATTPWFKRTLQSVAFLGAFLIFAVVGSAASVACFIPAALFRGVLAHRFGQKLIHRLFAFFVGYLRGCGFFQLDVGELSALRDSRGLILVANHPSLLDAVFVGSQVPRLVCLMKGRLIRNIVLSGTSRLAGYVHTDSRLGLVRKCEERLRQGGNLLIFPEGTRSVDGQMHAFKMGFALIAHLTQSPVQTVVITVDSSYLGKGWPLFRKPLFPVRYSLRLGKRFLPIPGEDARVFGRAIEGYFQSILSQGAKPAVSSPP